MLWAELIIRAGDRLDFMVSSRAGSCPFLLPFTLLVGLLLGGCSSDSPTDSIAEWIEPITGMEMVLIESGAFQMGSPSDEVGHESWEALHEVRLSRSFYIGRYEVTQGQWWRVLGENPSRFRDCGDDCPVEQVDWFDAQRFIGRLNELTGESFRLPTEAEWEYACRAGTDTPFATGENLTTDQANYDGRYPYPGFAEGVYRERPMPVGSFEANAWGLHDFHGNVWEWCQDWMCDYPEGPVIDPLGECESELRVIRGGSWYFNADSARCGVRYTHAPGDLGPSLGLRLVREIRPSP